VKKSERATTRGDTKAKHGEELRGERARQGAKGRGGR
jgi:hypothetical protein